MHTIMRAFLFSMLFSILCFMAGCTSLPERPAPEDGVRFFVLREKDHPRKYAAIEYWREMPGFLYLYADLLIDGVHFEVIQFVKFDPSGRVKETRHFLLKNGVKVVEGGVRVVGKEVTVTDRYFAHEREVHLNFEGEILHPARLEKVLLENPAVLTKKKFAFIDWRSVQPFTDTFRIGKPAGGLFRMPMDSGIWLETRMNEGGLQSLEIHYPASRPHPVLELVPVNQAVLDEAPGFKFDYGISSSYLKWAGDF